MREGAEGVRAKRRAWVKQRKRLFRQRTEVQFSMYGVQSEGAGGGEPQVVAGELIKSPTMKDLNEQCWDFIIKATGSLGGV